MTPSLSVKIEEGVALLRKAENIALKYSDDGFYLAFSGGKDSQAIYHLAKMAGVRFKAYFNLTSVDPPEVIRFVKKNYPDVTLVKPKDSIYHIAIKKKLLPTASTRWCCKEFKETASNGMVTIIGIRHEESPKRSARNAVEITSRKFSGTFEEFEEYRSRKEIEQRLKNPKLKASEVKCIGGKESLVIAPIIEWTECEVWEFLNDVAKVPHCKLYDYGLHRIGCIFCPMSSLSSFHYDLNHFPQARKNWIKAITEIQKQKNAEIGVWLLPPEEIFNWWISKTAFHDWIRVRRMDLLKKYNNDIRIRNA